MVIVNARQRGKNLIRRSLRYFGYRLPKPSANKQFQIHYESLAHFLYFKEIYDLISNLEGDIVECGVVFPEQMGSQDIYHLGCEAWVDEERKTCSPLNPKGQGDRDIVSPVVLVERADGKEVLVVGSKDGMLYALDPDASGKILWQTRVGRGGEVGGIQWGFASDGKNAYAPVNDMDADMKADGSFTAVDLVTGKSVWRVEKMTPVCEGKPTPPCSNAFGLPSTVANDVAFTGNADGVLRAYNTATGKLVWSFDTVRDYETVNGHKGYGGSVGYGGPVIVKNRMFVSSGLDYGNFGMAGNVLLMFELDE